MKIILFTHSQDIDGLGSAFLGRKAFKNDSFEYVLCKTFEITQKVSEYFESGKLAEYDKIFVADLCIKEPLLSKINESDLKHKIQVLDHHKSEIDEGNDRYDFVDVIVSQDGIKQCGTSLFYKYLLRHNLLEATPFYDQFVENTRQYDVWDWEKRVNQDAKKLNILFEELGSQKYLEILDEMSACMEGLSFNEYSLEVISNYEKNLQEALQKIYQTIRKTTITTETVSYRIAFVDSLYKYRNEIPDFIMPKEPDIDLVGINVTDGETISYRTNKPNVDCSLIGAMFGGKGHKAAGSNPKNNPKFKQFVEENGLGIE